MSPGRARSMAASMACAPVGDDEQVVVAPLAGRLGATRDLVEDGIPVLAARVLVGDDDDAGLARRRSGPSCGRFAVSRSPADPKTAISPPPRDAASGASRSRTVWSEAGLWAKSTMTPNGWPSSTRSMRPGHDRDRRKAVADRRGVQADGLAERDDRQRVVDVEPADELEVERTRPGRRVVGDPQALRRPPRPAWRGCRPRSPCRTSGRGRRPPGRRR